MFSVVKYEIKIHNVAQFVSVVTVMFLVDESGTSYTLRHFVIGSKLAATKRRKLEALDSFFESKINVHLRKSTGQKLRLLSHCQHVQHLLRALVQKYTQGTPALDL